MSNLFSTLFFLIVLTSCTSTQQMGNLSKIQLIDSQGYSETITTEDKLANLQKKDFLQPQPYQKVIRIYKKNRQGNTCSFITSYHDNGYLRQYLEIVNNRATGSYREWHSNGQLKVDSTVLGGDPLIEKEAQSSWIFDGINRVWDDSGNIKAEIIYEKGVLNGTTKHYYKNGQLKLSIPYQQNKIEGEKKEYYRSGALKSTQKYLQDHKEGESRFFFAHDQIAAWEKYKNGLLWEGVYYHKDGSPFTHIEEGNGQRIQYNKDDSFTKQQYISGKQNGIVECYTAQNELWRCYSTSNEMMEGEDYELYLSSPLPHGKKLSVEWHQDHIQGKIKTWYPNGQLESQKEMCMNRKEGLHFAWYPDGSLMLLEEYHQDRLIKGEYFKRQEIFPYTIVSNGKGIASLFDEQGRPVRKIRYDNGMPQEKQ